MLTFVLVTRQDILCSKLHDKQARFCLGPIYGGAIYRVPEYRGAYTEGPYVWGSMYRALYIEPYIYIYISGSIYRALHIGPLYRTRYTGSLYIGALYIPGGAPFSSIAIKSKTGSWHGFGGNHF